MGNLNWIEGTRGHWEADHCGMCLHVFRSLNGACWSVYDQNFEIDCRGEMVLFEEAKALAVAAAEKWNASNELAAVTAERDAYLETIRATFRVLESRGQAPDDNAPLQVTARRVLDFLDKVTAERDALSVERDNLKARVELLEAYARADATSALYVGTERDTLAAQLAAMQKRVSDAPRITVFEMDGELCHSRPEPRDWRVITKPIEHGDIVALVRLGDGE